MLEQDAHPERAMRFQSTLIDINTRLEDRVLTANGQQQTETALIELAFPGGTATEDMLRQVFNFEDILQGAYLYEQSRSSKST